MLLTVTSACGDPASPEWTGTHRVLELELVTPVNPGVLTWWLQVDLTVAADDTVTGWSAWTGVGSGGDVTRVTLGSTQVTGTAAGARVELDAHMLYVEPGLAPVDTLQLDQLGLVLGADGTVTGHVQGTWHEAAFDSIEDHAFAVDVTGAPDTDAPTVIAPAQALPPFSSLHLVMSEPVEIGSAQLHVEVDGTPVPAVITPRADPGRSGWARAFDFAPMSGTFWPESAALRVHSDVVRDAAGVAATGELARVNVLGALDSAGNLGFEAGPDGWYTLGPASFQGTDSTGTITAPEGSTMALLSARLDSEPYVLIGRVVPPPGATRVRVQAGMTDVSSVAELENMDQGFVLALATPASGVHDVITSSQLPTETQLWTGFAALTADLPADADGGVWLLVGCSGFAPPIFIPECLVDAISFE